MRTRSRKWAVGTALVIGLTVGVGAFAEEVARLYIRGTADGSIEVLVDGVVTEVYPPGSLYVSSLSHKAFARLAAWRETVEERARQLAEERKEQGKARAEAAETAAQERMRAERERQANEKKAIYEAEALQLVNMKADQLVMAVPAWRLPEASAPQERSAYRKRNAPPAQDDTLVLWDNLNHTWVRAIPLDTLNARVDAELK